MINSGITDVWNGNRTAQDYVTSILPQVQKLFDDNRPR